MSTTLFDLTYELARLLGTVIEGVATGGAVGSLIDTVERTEDDDYWTKGTVWIIRDAAGAAPEKEYGVITGFTNATATATLRDDLTAAIASGDDYAIANQRYPLQILRQKINEAIGVIPKTDTSTITIASDQQEYTLPTDCLQLRQVFLQLNSDSNANQWQKFYDWEVQKTAGGSADTLVLGRQLDTGYVLKLVYVTYHAELLDSSDVMDESYFKQAILHNAAVGCLLWRKARVGDSDLSINELLNYYLSMAQQSNRQFPQQLPSQSDKIIHPVFINGS